MPASSSVRRTSRQFPAVSQSSPWASLKPMIVSSLDGEAMITGGDTSRVIRDAESFLHRPSGATYGRPRRVPWSCRPPIQQTRGGSESCAGLVRRGRRSGALRRSSRVSPVRCARPASRCSRLPRRMQPCDSAVPSVPPRLSRPCMRDLARSAFEFLQRVRAGAQGQRERASGLAGGHLQRLLDEEPAAGRGRRGLADHRSERPGHPARMVGGDPPARRGRPRGASSS